MVVTTGVGRCGGSDQRALDGSRSGRRGKNRWPAVVCCGDPAELAVLVVWVVKRVAEEEGERREVVAVVAARGDAGGGLMYLSLESVEAARKRQRDLGSRGRAAPRKRWPGGESDVDQSGCGCGCVSVHVGLSTRHRNWLWNMFDVSDTEKI